MRIDFNKLIEISNVDTRYEYIENVIDKCTPEDPIFISDCIIRARNIGGVVLEMLGRDEKTSLTLSVKPMMWKIMVLRDEWGNPPEPGEHLVKTNKLPYVTRSGKPIPSTDINMAMSDGTYSKRFEQRVEYEIDKKGCITASFTDTVYFLNNWGIHPTSGASITRSPKHSTEKFIVPLTSKQELSSRPRLSPDEQMRHIWYWRNMEADAEKYASLPLIEKLNEPKRGVKKEDEKANRDN